MPIQRKLLIAVLKFVFSRISLSAIGKYSTIRDCNQQLDETSTVVSPRIAGESVLLVAYGKKLFIISRNSIKFKLADNLKADNLNNIKVEIKELVKCDYSSRGRSQAFYPGLKLGDDFIVDAVRDKDDLFLSNVFYYTSWPAATFPHAVRQMFLVEVIAPRLSLNAYVFPCRPFLSLPVLINDIWKHLESKRPGKVIGIELLPGHALSNKQVYTFSEQKGDNAICKLFSGTKSETEIYAEADRMALNEVTPLQANPLINRVLSGTHSVLICHESYDLYFVYLLETKEFAGTLEISTFYNSIVMRKYLEIAPPGYSGNGRDLFELSANNTSPGRWQLCPSEWDKIASYQQ